MNKLKMVVMFTLVGILFIGCSGNNIPGPVNAEKSKIILTQQGYRDIQITGYDIFACSDDDFYHAGFVAINNIGNRVEGTVCSGMFFKSSTIRFK